MDKLMRIAVMFGALLAGSGVFYHYVVFLPGLERTKQEQAATEKREAAEQANAKQVVYESCKQLARATYESNWATACESVANERTASMRNCLVDPAIMKNEFLGKEYCKRTYGDVDPSPSCTLPGVRATAINGYRRTAEDKCLAEAKTGL